MSTTNTAVATQPLEVIALEPTIGAEIYGVDLSQPLSDERRQQIRQLLLQYKVLFFREQNISSTQQIAFARQFGEPYVHPTTVKDNEQLPAAHLIRTEDAAKAYGDARKGRWHTDTSWMLQPTWGAVLRAVALPETGGDTVWADSALVYQGLSDELKQKIDSLYVVHNFKSELDKVNYPYPVVSHPLVRTHPETGQDGLFINFSLAPYILGWSPEDSKDLINQLLKAFSNPEYHVRFKWSRNAVAFWDNRATLHYPVYNYGNFPRVMERVLIAGDDIPHRVRHTEVSPLLAAASQE
ncbi:TauD/TfdA family dioxygenase [Chromatiaceae bacterium AAb-1]|nr:TauD/TfdA family dioxygenase [Chromatiaceae bacterium AAb-1]